METMRRPIVIRMKKMIQLLSIRNGYVNFKISYFLNKNDFRDGYPKKKTHSAYVILITLKVPTANSLET